MKCKCDECKRKEKYKKNWDNLVRIIEPLYLLFGGFIIGVLYISASVYIKTHIITESVFMSFVGGFCALFGLLVWFCFIESKK